MFEWAVVCEPGVKTLVISAADMYGVFPKLQQWRKNADAAMTEFYVKTCMTVVFYYGLLSEEKPAP